MGWLKELQTKCLEMEKIFVICCCELFLLFQRKLSKEIIDPVCHSNFFKLRLVNNFTCSILHPYNWLCWLLLNWVMLLVPWECFKPLLMSHSIYLNFADFFLHSSLSTQFSDFFSKVNKNIICGIYMSVENYARKSPDGSCTCFAMIVW